VDAEICHLISNVPLVFQGKGIIIKADLKSLNVRVMSCVTYVLCGNVRFAFKCYVISRRSHNILRCFSEIFPNVS